MEVFVSGPFFKFSSVCVPAGCSVGDLRDSLTNQKGFPPLDFYVSSNGRLSELQDPVQHGAVYQLLPRLRGGKGGFGSMLRALGAQIEKTTNREACRDLSGRRLRDVNHEKEMAEWLKKQAEREAEKEQRRLERLQRKLSEPKHQFSDAEYQQQCHDLAERLEDSVLKGMQASSSGLVQPAERAAKRTNQDHSQTSAKRKCFWKGAGDLDELDSSEEEEDQEDQEDQTPSTSASGLSPETQEPEPEEKPKPEPERAAEPEPEDKPAPEQAAEPERSSSAAEHPEASSSHTQQAQAAAEEPVAPVVPVDLRSAVSAEQLESLGLDVLKEELSRRGLKCGGTLAERAARLFSVRGLKPEQIDPALLAKPAKGKRK